MNAGISSKKWQHSLSTNEEPSMNISEMRFPRQLEADGSDTAIRRALMAKTTKLWPDSRFAVPVIELCESLKKALKTARLQGRIRCGAEAIFEKLAAEKTGIAQVKSQSPAPYGDRVSRLLLFSNDGAERFYRNIEQTILTHSPRLLGCLLDIDGEALGQLITGREGIIKIVMAEHKDVVSAILRALVENQKADIGDPGGEK